MKFKKFSMLLAVALLMMCSFALGAHAAGTAEPITAYMRYDVDVKYNGESVVMKNVNGVRVYPLSIVGTVYGADSYAYFGLCGRNRGFRCVRRV